MHIKYETYSLKLYAAEKTYARLLYGFYKQKNAASSQQAQNCHNKTQRFSFLTVLLLFLPINHFSILNSFQHLNIADFHRVYFQGIAI